MSTNSSWNLILFFCFFCLFIYLFLHHHRASRNLHPTCLLKTQFRCETRLHRSLCCLQSYPCRCLTQANSFSPFRGNLIFLLAKRGNEPLSTKGTRVRRWGFPLNNFLFWCLELSMQHCRASCSGPAVPKELTKEKSSIYSFVIWCTDEKLNTQ
jgi:hypothetical protein